MGQVANQVLVEAVHAVTPTGIDVYFGRALKEVNPSLWDEGIILEAWHLVRRHKEQLPEYGIDFQEIPTPELRQRQEPEVTVEQDWFVIKTEYDPLVVGSIKNINGRYWNPQRKVWLIPITSVRQVRNFCKVHNIRLSDDAEQVPDCEPSDKPIIDIIGQRFILRFDYDRDLIARVKDIPTSRWSPKLRGWTVDLEAGFEVAQFAIAIESVIKPEAQLLLGKEQEAISRIEQSLASEAELNISSLGGELLPFQKAGVLYALKAMGYQLQETGVWIHG